MALLDWFTPEEIAAELRRLGYTVTPPTSSVSTPPPPRRSPPSWLVERDDDEGLTMLGRGEDDL